MRLILFTFGAILAAFSQAGCDGERQPADPPRVYVAPPPPVPSPEISDHELKALRAERLRLEDARTFRIVARYSRRRTKDRPGAAFILSRSGERWRVQMGVGAYPDGAATRADCYTTAIGRRSGDRIEAYVVSALVGETARRPPPRYSIQLQPDGAVVLEDASGAGCEGLYDGRGSYLPAPDDNWEPPYE